MHNKRWIKYMILVVAALMIMGTFSGCYLLPQEEDILEIPLLEAREVEYQTLEVEKGEIISYVSASGTFESAKQAGCFFEYKSGRLGAIYVGFRDEVKEGDILAELDTDTLKREERTQYYNLQKAKLRYEHLQDIGAESYDVTMAEYDYLIAENNYGAVLDELNKSILYAPIDGVISYVARVLPGDIIDAYTDLFRIIDPYDVQLVVEGEKAESFKTGITVEVSIKDNTYEGEVVQSPGDIPINPADRDATPRAIIEVDGYKPDEKAIGNSANIEFVKEYKDNVIVIPKSLVHNYFGRTYVKVLMDGEKIEVDVEEGIKTSTEVEIVEGLSEGDLVIIK